MLVNFNENYITVFATNISYHNVFTHCTTRSGSHYKNGLYKTKIKDVHELR